MVLIVTFADAAGPESQVFETILAVDGDDPTQWKDGVLRVEKAVPPGPFVTGSVRPLGEIPWIAEVMSTAKLG